MSYFSNKSRVLVNIIGIPSILAIIYFGDDFSFLPLFSMFVFSVALIAIYEWNKLANIKSEYDMLVFTLDDNARIEVWELEDDNWGY